MCCTQQTSYRRVQLMLNQRIHKSLKINRIENCEGAVQSTDYRQHKYAWLFRFVVRQFWFFFCIYFVSSRLIRQNEIPLALLNVYKQHIHISHLLCVTYVAWSSLHTSIRFSVFKTFCWFSVLFYSFLWNFCIRFIWFLCGHGKLPSLRKRLTQIFSVIIIGRSMVSEQQKAF